MSVVTKTIGTSSRDYSTMAAWEADLDNGAIYAAGDDAVGECYDDSAFTGGLTMNGGATVGLNSVRLTTASGERHAGTAATGVRMVGGVLALYTPSTAFNGKYTVEWIEWDANGGANGVLSASATGNSYGIIKNCLFHDNAGSSEFMNFSSRDVRFQNNITYDHSRNGSSLRTIITAANVPGAGNFNNTFYKTANASGTAAGVYVVNDDVDGRVRNNIVAAVSGFTTVLCFQSAPGTYALGTWSHNLSDDASADDYGSGNLINQTLANLFVSTVDGSEDLRLKSGSPAIDVGVDLGTTPTGVNIDILGRDRDAQNDTWDIGAHEYVAGDAPSTVLLFARRMR